MSGFLKRLQRALGIGKDNRDMNARIRAARKAASARTGNRPAHRPYHPASDLSTPKEPSASR
jgi:hypothetical protein